MTGVNALGVVVNFINTIQYLLLFVGVTWLNLLHTEKKVYHKMKFFEVKSSLSIFFLLILLYDRVFIIFFKQYLFESYEKRRNKAF